MKKIISTAIVGATALATSLGIMALGSGVASAATPTPPWQNATSSPNSVASLALYDNTGAQVTHGSIMDSPVALYAQSSGVLHAGDTKAALFLRTASLTVNPGDWAGEQLGNFSTYPLTTGPANVVAGSNFPTATNALGDDSIAADIAGNGSSAADGNASYQNVYEFRIQSANGGTLSVNYASMDIKVSGVTTDAGGNITGGTWTQIYPAPPAVPSVSTPVPSVASPAAHGTAVTLTATVSESDGSTPAAGSVELFDGVTDVGPATFTASSGAITDTLTPADGDHSYTFKYTPTGGTAVTSGALAYHVNLNIPTPNVAVGVSGDNTDAGGAATLTATVTVGSPAAPEGAGTVLFYDNGSATPIAGTVGTTPTGTYTLATTFAAGNHAIVAKFTPTPATPPVLNPAQGTLPTFTTTTPLIGACAVVAVGTTPGSQCTDVQNIQASIPVGTIVISTPYTPASPLDLGNLVLQPNATEYKGTAAFAPIVITDSSAGDKGYTVSALSSDLVDGHSNPGSTIDSQNVGLTGLSAAGSAGFSATVVTSDNPAADPAVAPGAALGAAGHQGLGISTHTVATADHGIGTLTLSGGTLTITAPTSTESGLFTGTITFTVVENP